MRSSLGTSDQIWSVGILMHHALPCPQVTTTGSRNMSLRYETCVDHSPHGACTVGCSCLDATQEAAQGYVTTTAGPLLLWDSVMSGALFGQIHHSHHGV